MSGAHAITSASAHSYQTPRYSLVCGTSSAQLASLTQGATSPCASMQSRQVLPTGKKPCSSSTEPDPSVTAASADPAATMPAVHASDSDMNSVCGGSVMWNHG